MTKQEWIDSELGKTYEKMKADYDRLEELEIKVKEQENIIHGLAEGGKLWEQEYNDCRSILRELVELKIVKDTHGKTEDYIRRKEAAWEKAMKFLEQYQHLTP